MKKLIKSNIFSFFLGAILFGGIGTVVATTILSSTVSYTNNNQTTVESALDELYDIASRLDSCAAGNNGITYVYWNGNFSGSYCSSTQVPGGTGLSGTYATREALAAAYSNWNNAPIYIKTTKENRLVTGHAACLWYNDQEFCISPNYWDTDGVTTKNKLKADMENALGISINDSNCESGEIYALCYAGTFNCYANSSGVVNCFSHPNGEFCYVDGSGSAACEM